MLGIGQAHQRRNEMSRPGQAREDGNQEGHLKGDVPCLGVIILMISSWVFCGCPASCFSSWVSLTTSASCSRVFATCCCSAGDSTVLDWASNRLAKPS